MPDLDFDVVVIGSGFGGSVMTCRLSESGHRVCLLERGREYGMNDFPRRMHDLSQRAFWDPAHQRYGFMEVRDYPESDVVTVSASGLGGGSLIYANVLMRMPAEHFAGWPGGVTRETLDPFYDRALDMLEASPYPFEQSPYYADTPKTRAFQQAAARMERPEDALADPEFIFPHLAVRFEGEFPGHQTLNKQGVLQSSCIKCGECDIGCNIHAKNTLDLNYIARARRLPTRTAEVRTGALVSEVRPLEGGGYAVTYETYEGTERPSGGATVTARRVVVSAGSVGSTGLLLRMKRDGVLPRLSEQLGRNWCGNGDLEGTVLFAGEQIVPTNGPVITGALRYEFKPYSDGFPHGAVIQDAGFPAFIGWYLVARIPSAGLPLRTLRMLQPALGHRLLNFFRRRASRRHRDLNLGNQLANLIDGDDVVRRTFLLLGMGRDRSDGRIELRSDGEPVVKWRLKESRLHYARVRREMGKLAKALGGRFVENPLSRLNKIVAVHPLGGCAMADSPEQGVVNTNGEAFGHPGLYVVDASILPTSVGPNPSLTIAAMAEYIASRFPEASAPVEAAVS